MSHSGIRYKIINFILQNLLPTSHLCRNLSRLNRQFREIERKMIINRYYNIINNSIQSISDYLKSTLHVPHQQRPEY